MANNEPAWVARVQELLASAPPETGTVIDFSPGGLGADAAYTPDPGSDGLTGTAWCWWPESPQPGDHAILRAGSGRTSRYRITEVERQRDPRDMYHLRLVFDPRPAVA